MWLAFFVGTKERPLERISISSEVSSAGARMTTDGWFVVEDSGGRCRRCLRWRQHCFLEVLFLVVTEVVVYSDVFWDLVDMDLDLSLVDEVEDVDRDTGEFVAGPVGIVVDN